MPVPHATAFRQPLNFHCCPSCRLQIHLEIERARLTMKLALSQEADGNVSGNYTLIGH